MPAMMYLRKGATDPMTMGRGVQRIGCLLCALSVLLGCQSLSDSPDPLLGQSSRAHSDYRAQLTVGSYVIEGVVQFVGQDNSQHRQTDTARVNTTSATSSLWRFVHPDTELVFDHTGLRALHKLDGKPILLQLAHYSQGNKTSTHEEPSVLRVRLGAAPEVVEYIVQRCTSWHTAWETRTRECEANGDEPSHRIQVTLQDSQPVAMRQWLPYLRMFMTLQRI